MKQPYEILLRFDQNTGIFKGGHTARFDTVARTVDDPLPIGVDKLFPWPEEAAAINRAVLAHVSELDVLISEGNAQRVALQAELDKAAKEIEALKKQKLDGLEKIKAAVLDPKTETDPAVLAIVHEETKDERTKWADALSAQIAELQAKRESLK